MTATMRALAIRIMRRMLRDYDSAGPTHKRMVSLVMHRFPGQMPCREFGDFLSAYLDDEMTPAERRRFEFHLAACPRCLTHLEEFRVAMILARSNGVYQTPAVPDELLTAVTAVTRQS